MNKTRRLILSASVGLLFAVTIFGYYYSNFIGLVLTSLAIDYFLIRQAIAKPKNWQSVSVRIIRPAMFFILIWSYYFTSVAVSGQRLLTFTLVAVISILWHGVLCQSELNPDNRDWFFAVEAGILIFLSTNVASLLIAHWGLPLALVLAGYLALNVLIALFWLARLAKNVNYLALVWGLAAAQIVWVSSHWLIFYQIPIVKLLISQNALLITTLAYSWGGIYSHYKDRNLTRRIILEYLTVLLAVIIVLLVLTRWRAI